MEMHQIRYFLAVNRTLNFTRAAEECNVSQPSLTRAIKLLEEEFGGELFRRERNQSHLTDLGQRMLPFLQQCFDTAQGAKSLASAIRKGDIATLRLGLSRTIEMTILIPFLSELVRAMNGLELKFLRGTADEIAEFMKQGDVDLAIAGPLTTSWDRFDARPLFTEPFVALVDGDHRHAGQASIKLEDLHQERMLIRTYCEQAEQLAALLRSREVKSAASHEVSAELDLIALLESRLGIAVAPKSTTIPITLRRVAIDGIELTRTVYLYSVAGRPRSAAAGILCRQLQAADWPRLIN